MYHDIFKQAFSAKINNIRLIPHGTFDNNLGLDRLASPKALDPNYCRQPTLSLHGICLKVLSEQGTGLHLRGQGIPPTHTNNVAQYNF